MYHYLMENFLLYVYYIERENWLSFLPSIEKAVFVELMLKNYSLGSI